MVVLLRLRDIFVHVSGSEKPCKVVCNVLSLLSDVIFIWNSTNLFLMIGGDCDGT
jgi:hypothetical protein